MFESRKTPPAYNARPPIIVLKKFRTPYPVARYFGSATIQSIGIILESPNALVKEYIIKAKIARGRNVVQLAKKMQGAAIQRPMAGTCILASRLVRLHLSAIKPPKSNPPIAAGYK